LGSISINELAAMRIKHSAAHCTGRYIQPCTLCTCNLRADISPTRRVTKENYARNACRAQRKFSKWIKSWPSLSPSSAVKVDVHAIACTAVFWPCHCNVFCNICAESYFSTQKTGRERCCECDSSIGNIYEVQHPF